jgi:hypothetical protein
VCGQFGYLLVPEGLPEACDACQSKYEWRNAPEHADCRSPFAWSAGQYVQIVGPLSRTHLWQPASHTSRGMNTEDASREANTYRLIFTVLTWERRQRSWAMHYGCSGAQTNLFQETQFLEVIDEDFACPHWSNGVRGRGANCNETQCQSWHWLEAR